MTAADHDEESFEDFDAFWAERRQDAGGHRIRVFGELVTLPTELPMDVEWRLEAVRDLPADRARAEIEELVGLLYGDGVLERWRAHGITGRQFQVLLVYGIARASGRDVSLEDAFTQVTRAHEEQAAPFRSPRSQRSSGGSSNGTGGRSRRTSSGSTASTPPGSRR
ncbi:MAG TPA: hypothetical protein VHJ17_13060 [Thermomonospora sp.]|nr:hypothetical protein [Thermomonospora sp.]